MIESMKNQIGDLLLLLDSINNSIERIKQEIKKLTKAGVQNGTIYFKTDRPGTMFIYEPMKDGKRKYVHVGKDPKKQDKKRAEIERWHKRDHLQNKLARYEQRLSDLNYRISSVGDTAEWLESDCREEAIKAG